MRVAIRRLRSLLVLFERFLEPHVSERFEEELRRLGQVLGVARDWDVFLTDTLPRAETRIGRWPSAAKIFLKPDLTALAPGDLMVQKDLAATLEAIAQHGPRAFYDGPIAEKLAAGIQAAGGIMTAQDLRDYRPILRRLGIPFSVYCASVV